MIKGLFNLILLLALCAGAFYVYVNVTEDYELIAQIKNTQDQLLLQLQEFVDQVKQDLDDMKRDAEDMKRSVGVQHRA